jgi:hypothetical protein
MTKRGEKEEAEADGGVFECVSVSVCAPGFTANHLHLNDALNGKRRGKENGMWQLTDCLTAKFVVITNIIR